jgi:hypothetical protein
MTQSQIWPTASFFVNKVLLEHGFLFYTLWLFLCYSGGIENRDWLYYVALYRKIFADPWYVKDVNGTNTMTLANEWLKFGKFQSELTPCFVACAAENQGREEVALVTQPVDRVEWEVHPTNFPNSHAGLSSL